MFNKGSERKCNLDDKEYHPVYILVEELNGNDIERKKRAIKNLTTLAIVLGPERTRDELLKYITELIRQDEEVLLEFLKPELFIEMLHFIGGTKHIKWLFDVLESQATSENIKIRPAAINTIKELVTASKPSVVQEPTFELTMGLLKGEWFTSKTSGLELAIYMISQEIRSSNKQSLINQIMVASEDLMHQVRTAIAKHLSYLVDLMPHFSEDKLITLAQNWVSDMNEFVRNSWIEGIIKLSEQITDKTQQVDSILPLILKSFKDKNWRIRKMYLDQIPRIFK